MSTASAAPQQARWTLAPIVALTALALWLYRETLQSMVSLWNSSDTFAHGWVVPLISLWLVWQRRDTLARLVPCARPSASALVAIVAAGAAWLVGEAAEVNALRQFALVAMLVLAVPAISGWALTRSLAFPLGFLFFAVPFGDFLLPALMQWTADFTVMALRWSGIPVYRDGLQIVIPSGTWSVVEACSGVRYLIASAMVGAIFAHLNYRTTRRRLAFMGVALAVPIVANWLRAYGIVMLGHLSGNKLAVGVDHLIYGWAFFGVVVALMFAIGMRWAEPVAVGDGPRSQATPSIAPSPRGRALLPTVATAAAALMILPLLAAGATQRAVHTTPPVVSMPASVAALPDGEASLPEWVPAFRNPQAVIKRRFIVDGQPIGLHVAYYRRQGHDSKLVSSINALVGSSDPRWLQTAATRTPVQTASSELMVNAATLKDRAAADDEAGLIVWHFYWVDGAFESRDPMAKARSAWQRLRGAGDDGAVIVLYTQASPRGRAEAALRSFLHQHLAALEQQLRTTNDGD